MWIKSLFRPKPKFKGFPASWKHDCVARGCGFPLAKNGVTKLAVQGSKGLDDNQSK